jgi:hypothetical protein
MIENEQYPEERDELTISGAGLHQPIASDRGDGASF